MINRVNLFVCLALIALLVTGCSRENLVFGTYTELDVAGIEMRPTGDVALKIGFDRGEVAYVPDNGQDGYSVLGTFDSDLSLFSGYYISEVFATGEAANIASDLFDNSDDPSSSIASDGAGDHPEPTLMVPDGSDRSPPSPKKKDSGQTKKDNDSARPLLLTTGTRFGFHSIFSFTMGAATPVDIMLGYKRANLTVVPTKKGSLEARSTYAEILIGEGSRRKRAAAQVGAPIENPGNSPFGDGIIINQRIATGKAARNLAGKEKIRVKLLGLKNNLKTVNDLSDQIEQELNRANSLSAFEQARSKLAELATVNSNNITTGNFIQTAQAHLDVAGLEALLAFMKQLQ